MKKYKIIIILIIVVLAFGAGVYFRDDAVKLYNNFSKGVQDFQKTDFGQMLTQASKQVFSPAPLNVGGSASNVVLLQSKIILETNLQRQENGGLPALKENVTLNNVAGAKANDMFSKQYFEHISPIGVGPGDLAQSYGYDYIIEGENLILGNFSSEKELVQAWMDSSGHRANILNNRYTEIGVAIVKGIYKGQTVWIGVQEFGLPLSACAQPDVSLKNLINSQKTQIEVISSQIDQLRAQINNTNSKSAVYKQMVDDYNKMVNQYNLFAQQVKENVGLFNNQVNIFNTCVTGN